MTDPESNPAKEDRGASYVQRLADRRRRRDTYVRAAQFIGAILSGGAAGHFLTPPTSEPTPIVAEASPADAIAANRADIVSLVKFSEAAASEIIRLRSIIEPAGE